MLVDYGRFERLAHLRYVPLPGSDIAVKEPWRVAIAYLIMSGKEEWLEDWRKLPQGFADFLSKIGEEKVNVVMQMIKRGFNSPLASSVGRLFDAVASLLGVSHLNTYEGQSASELETIADETQEFYPFRLEGENPMVINPLPVIEGILADLRIGKSKGDIASRFHRSLVEMMVEVLKILYQKTGVNKVALSGGVFQNALLLSMALRRLKEEGFIPLSHRKVPTNDGGIALGQAVIARAVSKDR